MLVTNLEVVTATTPPGPCETEGIEPVQEQLVPATLVEVQMWQSFDNKLGGSNITDAQVT